MSEHKRTREDFGKKMHDQTTVLTDQLGVIQLRQEDQTAKMDELHEWTLGNPTEKRDFQTNEARVKELDRQQGLRAQERKELKQQIKEEKQRKDKEQRQKDKEEKQRKAREEKAQDAKAKKKAKPKPKASAPPSVEVETENLGLARACGAAASSRHRQEPQPGDSALMAPLNNLLKRSRPAPDGLVESDHETPIDPDDIRFRANTERLDAVQAPAPSRAPPDENSGKQVVPQVGEFWRVSVDAWNPALRIDEYSVYVESVVQGGEAADHLFMVQDLDKKTGPGMLALDRHSFLQCMCVTICSDLDFFNVCV